MKLTKLQTEAIKELFYLFLFLTIVGASLLVFVLPNNMLSKIISLILGLGAAYIMISLIIKSIIKGIKLTIRDWKARACLDENEYIVYNDAFTPIQNKIELQNKINKYLKEKKEKNK